MAKRRKSADKAAASDVALDERPVVVEEIREAPSPPPPPPPAAIIDKCGSCSVERRILYVDADLHWELPGHPDHINRPICYECFDSEFTRTRLCADVYAAMRKRLVADDMTPSEIEQAIHTAWRTFNVDYDHDALLKLAKQLKVKTSWKPVNS